MMLLALPRAESMESEFSDFCLATRVRTIALIALVTRDVHAAEDAAQEAYARAYQRWGRVRKLSRPDLWVVRVGTNVAISAWKKTRKESELDADELSTESVGSGLDGHIAQDLWVEWGLSSLSTSQRVAFVMHHAQGWSTADVAAAMGSSESTVKTHLARAKRRLRNLLGPDMKP
jgi:RNA polymerase sigma-70 factor (ECF subfamily)